ncbi:ABC transporter substrate-binding protein, partial [Rhizobium phaseoli]
AETFRAKGIEPEGYVLSSLAAALIAGQAAEAAAAAGKPLLETLLGTTFQTPVGAVAFTGTHELSQNPYRLLEWRGNGFFPPAAPTQ